MTVSLLGATSTLQFGKGQLRVTGGGSAVSGSVLMAALVSVLVEMLKPSVLIVLSLSSSIMKLEQTNILRGKSSKLVTSRSWTDPLLSSMVSPVFVFTQTRLRRVELDSCRGERRLFLTSRSDSWK